MTEPCAPPALTDLPIVCNPRVMDADRRAAHLALSVDVIARWPAERVELEDGFLFRYQGDEARFLALAGWAAAEHRCCPWAAYALEMGHGAGGTIQLRVRASAEGRAFLRTCYAYVDELRTTGAPAQLMDAEVITPQDLAEALDPGRRG